MEYQKAANLRKKGLISLIAERKFEEGRGLGSSIGSSISDKFKAKMTRTKEMMDPLNWVSKLVGKGTFGKVATTMAGRAFGRSDETISYFGGYKRKGGKQKDTKVTTIGPGPIRPLRMGDSSADILGKMYNFMRKQSEIDTQNYEIEKTFRQERLDEDERRHKELVDAIKHYMRNKKGAAGPAEEKTSLLDTLADLFKKLLPLLIAGLIAGLLGWLKNFLNLGTFPTLKVPEVDTKPKPEEKSPDEKAKEDERLKEQERLKENEKSKNERRGHREMPYEVEKGEAPKVEERIPFKDKVKAQKDMTPREKMQRNLERLKAAKEVKPSVVKPETTASKIGSAISTAGKTASKVMNSRASMMALKSLHSLLGFLNKMGLNKILVGANLIADLADIYDGTMKSIQKGDPVTGEDIINRALRAMTAAFSGVGGAELVGALGAVGGTYVGGPWGTLIGGLLGGAAGYYGGDVLARYLWDKFYDDEAKKWDSLTPQTDTAPPPVASPVPANKSIPPATPPATNTSGAGNNTVVNNVNNVSGSKTQTVNTTTPQSRNSDITRYFLDNAVMF